MCIYYIIINIVSKVRVLPWVFPYSGTPGEYPGYFLSLIIIPPMNHLLSIIMLSTVYSTKPVFRHHCLSVALRYYGWEPSNCPLKCVCSKTFSIENSQSCPKGGFPQSGTINEVGDLTATLLIEMCYDVCVAPELQPLSGKLQSRSKEPAWT